MSEINEELEDCLDELFPKKKINNDSDILNEIEAIISDEIDVDGNYLEGFSPKMKEVIKAIQKESGRDRALVLFALAQNKINELEKRLRIWKMIKRI